MSTVCLPCTETDKGYVKEKAFASSVELDQRDRHRGARHSDSQEGENKAGSLRF